ncbi:hypothetical protein K458DRAFT_423589 [Lentithecium fluviatile CBS 122367]|uniref:Uncharacterized protein n=1 Tax=Lentithecium fluviatile CBS 122367 TaxID=1168545 RepID=A0A6G1II50_9PLEO|nr:hypothetical protein K458DRAFT_423589 [Lentithecium fluviatile CBS 122367]
MLESDVTTLKSLRITCRNFNTLIQSYGKSIRSRILSRNYSRDLIHCFELPWNGESPVQALFDTDREIQTAMWMAALRLAQRARSPNVHIWPHRHDCMQNDYRPALDIMTMWENIVEGLSLMWRLHEWAREEIRADFGKHVLRAAAYISDVTRNHSQLKNLEERILQRQICFIRGLADTKRTSLYFAFGYCVRFSTSCVCSRLKQTPGNKTMESFGWNSTQLRLESGGNDESNG